MNITKREMKRKLRTGEVVELARYVLHFRDLHGRRKTKYFETRKEAEKERDQLIYDMKAGSYVDEQDAMTVKQVIDYWLKFKEGKIVEHTFKQNQLHREYICGPLLDAPRAARVEYGRTGIAPEEAKFERMLGDHKINKLTSAHIRDWYHKLSRITSDDTARRAKQVLAAAFDMVSEDFNIHMPRIPKTLSFGKRQKPKKKILTVEQAKLLIEESKKDQRWGLYIIFLFFTGVRIGEMLGLLWDDIDFTSNFIHIRHTQDMKGNVREFGKTDCSTRFIPLAAELKQMLLDWKERCPTLNGKLYRVFPAQGNHTLRPFKNRFKGGGPLLHSNFRNRVWIKAFRKLLLPLISPHAARHMFISLLQAQGVEVAVAAKLAGHADLNITLKHYSHAMRNPDGVMEKLMSAYS